MFLIQNGNLGKGRLMLVGLFACLLLLCPWAYADTADKIELMLNDAKVKVAQGDHKGAATLYSQILELDANHREARVQLSSVLIQAQMEAPHSDESDALKALLEPKDAKPLVE
jgi:thioredoxin-like negative regulator of GroEL